MSQSAAVRSTSEALRLQAHEWLVVLWSGEVTEEERNGFDAWLRASAEHRAAWACVQPLERQLDALPNARAAARALRASADMGRRRAVVRGLLALAGVGAGGYAVQRTPQWQAATADYRSAAGEVREIALADGSRVVLNTASALDVRFTARERRILLQRGEILVRTGADSAAGHGARARPFLVQTRQGTVRAVGTEFSVRQLEDESHVAVLAGAVQIQTLGSGGMPVRVDAGQQARFGALRVHAPQEAAFGQTAWVEGSLVVEQVRLQDFAEELARYRIGVIRVDPAIADLRVSGTYQLDDTDLVLRTLESSLPLQVRYLSSYWVRILPRPVTRRA